MKRELIVSLENRINEEVLLKGWVHRIRQLKSVDFIVLRDRTGMVQCVLGKNLMPEGLKHEAVVEIIGTLKEGKNSLHNYEVEVSTIKVLSKAEEELPIEINKDKLEVSLDVLLNNRVISLRNQRKNAVFRIQHVIVEGFREFLSGEGFIEIFTPKIVSEGAEGGTSLFKLNYFGQEAYLSQSPQFYKQMLVAAGYERVFEVGNFFRAEEHDTSRHLNQYTSMDLEMAFIEDEHEIMDMEEQLLVYIMGKLQREAGELLEMLEAQIPAITRSIPRIEFVEAVAILEEKFNKIITDIDLDPEAERLLCNYAKAELNSDFIFVTNYYREKRPMYTMPKGEAGTRSFDLLFRGMEITSGSQRIHDYNMLIESFRNKGLDYEKFNSYVSTFKFGVPPHGGLAIGLERLLSLLLGLANVREAAMFPRDRNRLTP